MRTSVTACLGLWLSLAGCGPATERPPEVLLGADPCDYCRMVISEERHATAAMANDGVARFDDPGCLLAWLDEGERGAVAIWVHDEERAWRRVDEAWFVIDPNGATPMASGILAFSSEEVAMSTVAEAGSPPVHFAALAEELSDSPPILQSKSRTQNERSPRVRRR